MFALRTMVGVREYDRSSVGTLVNLSFVADVRALSIEIAITSALMDQYSRSFASRMTCWRDNSGSCP